MSNSKYSNVIHEFKYPPYQILNLSDETVIVSGGGGSAKTGVTNKIELFQLNLPGTVKNLVSHNTAGNAIMSMRHNFNYVVAADGCNLKELIICPPNADQKIDGDNVEGRQEDILVERENETEGVVNMETHRVLENCFDASNESFAEISVVRYSSRSGDLIIAGSNNGQVKVFQRYSDEKPMELVPLQTFVDVSDGKSRSIMDLDVSPSLDEFVTICEQPDGKYARVWSISRRSKVTELALMSPAGKKMSFKCPYKFKHCRYASCYSRPLSFLLYTTHVPVMMDRKSQSFVSVWGPSDPVTGTDYQLLDVLPLGKNKTSFGSPSSMLVPTALSVSNDGSLSAIGSGEGQVDVYRFNHETHTISLVYRLPHAHSFFITDMAFLSSCYALNNGSEFELLSIGVDSKLRHHRLPTKPLFNRLEKLHKLLCVLIVLFVVDRIFLTLNVL